MSNRGSPPETVSAVDPETVSAVDPVTGGPVDPETGAPHRTAADVTV